LPAEAKGRLETEISNIGPDRFNDDDWAWGVFKGVEAVISELCDLRVLTSMEADEYSRRAQEAWDGREAVTAEKEVPVSVSAPIERSLSEAEQARRKKMTARLKECRHAAGLTIAEVAQRVADLSGEAVGASRYCNWELGIRTPPLDILVVLAKVFDKPLEYISGIDQDA
jgi:DNA-binding XRE family transcriptional regulator